jgi:hypothetical protein
MMELLQKLFSVDNRKRTMMMRRRMSAIDGERAHGGKFDMSVTYRTKYKWYLRDVHSRHAGRSYLSLHSPVSVRRSSVQIIAMLQIMLVRSTIS